MAGSLSDRINPIRGKKMYPIDVVGRLEEHFPVFLDLLGDNRLNWKTVEKVMYRKQQRETGDRAGTAEKDLSFFNIVAAVADGDASARSYLDFIKSLFEELIKKLDPLERKLIVPALFGLISNLDEKYQNFLGELLFLSHIKEATSLKLVDIEVPVVRNRPDGFRIDFQFIDSDNDSMQLFEVVNVHVGQTGLKSDASVKNMLVRKLVGKLDKMGINTTEKVRLAPVFWGSFDDVKRLYSCYKSTNIPFQKTYEPTAMIGLMATGNSIPVYSFRRLDDVYP